MEWYTEEREKLIFLYLIVVNNAVGRYVVAVMISETRNTVTTLNFLKEWTHLGAFHPKNLLQMEP